MTGTIEVPGTITIGPAVSAPDVVINVPGDTTMTPGAVPYPLASDPGQTWTSQEVGGVLTWVESVPPAGQMAWGLEDGLGAILLEDNAGVLLLEA